MGAPLNQEPPGGDFARYVEALVARSAAGLASAGGVQVPPATPPVPGLQQRTTRRRLAARTAAPVPAPQSPQAQPQQPPQQLPVPALAKVLPWVIGLVVAAFVILSIGGLDALYLLVFVAAIAVQLIQRSLRNRRK